MTTEKTSRPVSRGDRELLFAMERHLDSCFGAGQRFVFHELFSPTVHVDVHVIPPSDDYPFVRLVTCGMAEKPMTVPAEFGYSPYAEVTMALPADWPIQRMPLTRSAGWPLQLLQELARLPHDHSTHLWDGHTIPWGEPFSAATEMSSLIVFAPENAPEGFDEFDYSGNKVNILGLYPLHEAELQLCLNEGVQALYDRMDAAGITDIVDLKRPSVA